MQPPLPHIPGRGFGGPAANSPRPLVPNDYKLAPPPTNAYQTDLALAAAANTMAPMPMVSPTLHFCYVDFLLQPGQLYLADTAFCSGSQGSLYDGPHKDSLNVAVIPAACTCVPDN